MSKQELLKISACKFSKCMGRDKGLNYNLYCAKKMANFECRRFEIGLVSVRWSFAECNNFSEGSSEPTKDAQVIRVWGVAAPRVFQLKLLVTVHPTINFKILMAAMFSL